MTESPATGNKLAIVGAGSAGLIALFYAARRLTGWQIRCFERSGDVLGAWGDPYPGFVSTSTKYTTQFACHRLFDAATDGESARQRSDFFRDGEYGAYLRSFVRHHRLAPYIRLHSEVRRLERIGGRWRLTIAAPSEVQDGATQDVAEEDFDALILATGLAETPKAVPCEVEQLESLDDARSVRDKTVVVLGGGESAADIANRLADPALGNRVLMSLRTGIRVSPRYHPIKGVPSDFLRTRLMLS
ncbi:MAG: FAD-dependent oxidoreductase, partial [Acidobacteriota bacterium]